MHLQSFGLALIALRTYALTVQQGKWAENEDVSRKWAAESEDEIMYIQEPKPTSLEDIQNVDLSDPDFKEQVRLVDFPVTLVVGGDAWSQDLIEHRAFETTDVMKICMLYKEHGMKGNLLDVGAHRGSFSLPFSLCVNEHASVISVEGSPRNAHFLKAGLKVSGIKNVQLYEYALANTHQENSILFDELPWGEDPKGMRNGILAHGQRKVPITGLDAIADMNEDMKHVFAMKMDIEGGEVGALASGAEWFKTNPPCFVMIEMNWRRGMIAEFLKRSGYEIQREHGARNMLWGQTNMTECLARMEASE